MDPDSSRTRQKVLSTLRGSRERLLRPRGGKGEESYVEVAVSWLNLEERRTRRWGRRACQEEEKA